VNPAPRPPSSRPSLRPAAAGLLLGLLLGPGCSRLGAPADPADGLPAELFGELAAFYAADYPANPAALEACRAKGPGACGESARRVEEAQAKLLAHGQEPASRALLRVLSDDCAGIAAGKLAGKELAGALARCKGAGVALALVDDPVLDQRFRRFFTFQPLELYGLVLTTGGEPWAFGRGEPPAWSALLRQAAPKADAGVPDEVWERLAREVEAPTRPHPRPAP
jgi:hypothetical protein